MAADGVTIKGHPTVELPNKRGEPVLITVCAECGEMRTVLFLSYGPNRDRWYCRNCRAQGDTRPAMFPIG